MRQKRKAIGRTKPLFIAGVLTAGLISCGKPDKPRQVPMLPETPRVCETIELPRTRPEPPGLYTKRELKVVRKGDHILRHYFPLEKDGVLSLKVSEIGRKGIALSGDTNIFRSERPIWLRYEEKTELYGSAMVLELYVQKSGPDSAMVQVTMVADKP